MVLKKLTAALLVFLLLTTSLGAIQTSAASPTTTGLNLPVVKTYKAGEVLNFTAVFNEDVTVTGGIPSLKLDIGGTVREAIYVSGFSKYVQFSYTVQSGDDDADGIQILGSIQLNGASITNSAAEDADLGSGFGPNGASVMDTGIKIDTVIPTILSVSYPADKTYTTGESLLFTVAFSENIVVNTRYGTPYLSLNIGGTEVRAEFFYSIGSNQIIFQYIVEPGLEDLDGITLDSEVKMYGGTIRDTATNLIIPGFPEGTNTYLSGVQVSTGGSSFITEIPADGYYKEGDILNFALLYPTDVSVTGEPYLPLFFGTTETPTEHQAKFAEVSGNKVIFQYIVQSGEEALNGIRIGNAIQLNGGSINDSIQQTPVSNMIHKLALSDVVVDAVLPNVQFFSRTPMNRNYTTGESFEFMVRFSEPVKVNGTPSLSLMAGGRSVAQAVYVPDAPVSQSTDLVFRYTVQSSDNDVFIDALGLLDSTNGSIVDYGGNTSQASVGSYASVRMVLNAATPTITSVEMPEPKSYYEGDELLFKMHFSEAVRAYTNRAILPVTIGSNTVNAIYDSGSRTDTLTFKYVVQASDLDADIMTVGSSLLSNGGTLISKDGYGIQADLRLNNVGSTSGIIFGQAAPQALNVSITGTAQVGSTLNGSYTYQDKDSDAEGKSTFQWYRSVDALGTNKTAIPNAATLSYTLQAADIGKYISFEVTPIAQTGKITGLAVESGFTSAVTASSVTVPTIPTAPTSPATNGNSIPTPTADVDIIVNGKVERAGTIATSKRDGQQLLTVTIDQKKLEDKLATEKPGATVVIPVNIESDVVVVELNGQMIQAMEQMQATLEMRTNEAVYTLPMQQINTSSISDQIGKSIALQDIKLQIEIAKLTEDAAKVLANIADKEAFTTVVPPIEFTVRALHEGRTIVVSKFSTYIERMITIPNDVDPKKITTSVVVEPDGSVRHVPTKVVLIDGKYYAKINSLTNSSYLLIWHPIEFSDSKNHWAREAVNDLGSRMVVDGLGDGSFRPDSEITRAEFVDILIRGLGIKLGNEVSPFSDVKASDWYNDAIHTAYSYQLVNGLQDGCFHPNARITREEAMVITAKAMKITGLSIPSDPSIDKVLHPYTDAAKASHWALNGIADNIQAGIIMGKSSTILSPNDHMTRAEAAVIVRRLLQKSDLI
ncbi:S-layer homology domain-containing protein [Paenibacillus amylolyticus]|uniref:S-layer homology domain-containing protein n=1 Tax=Paenibacillus amylolyticus TaxID=1451 RepID=UPI003D97E037